jgi:hypothetical protein
MVLRRTLVLVTLILAALGLPSSAVAQITRLGATFGVIDAATRGNAVAYDSRNDVYLVVGSFGVVRGRFISADGTPLGAPFVIQSSANFTHFPSVAYSPDADGGNGGFLVTWHESDAPVTTIHCRIVSYTSGGPVGAETRLDGTESWWEQTAGIAYSSVSREFLVTWRGAGNAFGNVYAARINASGGLVGSVFPVAATSAFEDNPSATYNRTTNEFFVLYVSKTEPPLTSVLVGRRIAAGSGAFVGDPVTIAVSVGIYVTDASYDSITGLYFAVWYQDPPQAIYGRLLNADGTPAGNITPLSVRFAAYDGLSVGHNRTSGTFFAITHDRLPPKDGGSTEDGGVEIDATGTPLTTGEIITGAAGFGNFYPRIAAHATRPEWLVSSAHNFVSTIAQRIGSDRRSGAPPLDPLPPPPPPSGAKLSLTRSALTFGVIAGTNMGSSGGQAVGVRFANGTANWTVSSSVSFVQVSPASGAGDGSFNVSLVAGKYSAGTEGAVITVTAPGTSNVTVSLPVTVFTRAVGGNPIGLVDTPPDNLTGVTGALAVTGWALDDLGVNSVTIWRDHVAGETPSANGKIFVGRAVQVEGSRPDVDTAFALPFDFRAGWGYMLLTNMLPNQGNGKFVLHAFAEDIDGHASLLGSRTITCTNATATRPFGTLDKPDQGESVSGATYMNFGWALTPKPHSIPTDGSTIVVLIDGVAVGHPTYNQNREDIATLFPGLANSNGAIGFFPVDTTTLSNGLHTIAWIVTDSNGTTEGIGSRYFSVLNGAASSSLTLERNSSVQELSGRGPETLLSAGPGSLSGQPAAAVASLPQSSVPVYMRTGYDPAAPLNIVDPDPRGVAVVRAAEVGRLILTLGPSATVEGDGYEGYLVAGDTLAPLPPGTFLDRTSGEFYWQPGVGFVGSYDLVFVHTDQGVKRRIPVAVRIGQ